MYSDANNMRTSADSRILRGYSMDDRRHQWYYGNSYYYYRNNYGNSYCYYGNNYGKHSEND